VGYVWGEKDIIAGSRYSMGRGEEVWMIGYLSFETSKRRYVSISTIDGLVTDRKTREQLAEDLTKSGYRPWPTEEECCG
jgi:hypothetical protein